ncbi:hypothetical protein ABT234_21135 [Streptomyces sp. NPDC001586]|uniref:hypothetical protein n=1 Tax=unclassified Streptomyces TaxID=2593676 RepID=UPI003324D2BD
MPKTDVARARAQRGTTMLFVAAAVLAAVGVILLLGLRGGERPHASGSTPTVAPSTAAPENSPNGAKPAETPLAAERSEPPAVLEQSLVPAPIQEAARAFTSAWASHDARPGRDISYDDASRRAAAHADGDLAEDLRTHTSGSAGRQQWLNWRDRQVQVTATVLRVSLPDGAPAPTEDSGFARVIYKLTETPAKGPATESEEQVALKVRRGADGSWRVVGLPNV